MANGQAGWWVAAGLGQTLAGMMLLRADDPFLLTLWGVALLLFGGVTTVVGTGAWLRIWR
jgi:hypothetical protein